LFSQQGIPAQAAPQFFDLFRQFRQPRLRRLKLCVPGGQPLLKLRDPGTQGRKLARRRDIRHTRHKPS